MKKTIFLALIFPIFSMISINLSFAAIPVPTSQQFYQYPSIATPVVNSDPAKAKPFGVGSIAEGDTVLNLQIATEAFSGPVDIYLALYLPVVDCYNFYLINSDNSLQVLSDNFLPWRSNTSDLVNEQIFGEIPMRYLPKGTYYLYFLVTPPNSLDSYYLWATNFFIGGWEYEEVETTIINTFGEDAGFDATVLAMDKGYSLSQIVEATVTDRLALNGDITAYAGGLETPEYSSTDLILADAKTMNEINETDAKITPFPLIIRKLCEYQAKKFNEEIIRLIYKLLNLGYSSHQIIEGIILGNITEFSIDSCDQNNKIELKFIGIADNTAKLIIPERTQTIKKGIFEIPILQGTIDGPKTLYLDPSGKVSGTWTITLTGGKAPIEYYWMIRDENQEPVKCDSEKIEYRKYSFSFDFTKTGRYGLIFEVSDDKDCFRSFKYSIEVKAFKYCYLDYHNLLIDIVYNYGNEFRTGAGDTLVYTGDFIGSSFLGHPDFYYYSGLCSAGDVLIEMDNDDPLKVNYFKASIRHSGYWFTESTIEGGGLRLKKYDNYMEGGITGMQICTDKYITSYEEIGGREANPSLQYKSKEKFYCTDDSILTIRFEAEPIP